VLWLSDYCVEAHASRQHHAPVRVLTHIKKLDDAFGQFLVRVICDCGSRVVRSSPRP
jgi:hypothetical protein